MDVIRRHRFTEEYRDILFSKILGEIKRMRKQCIPGLPPAIEGLGTRLTVRLFCKRKKVLKSADQCMSPHSNTFTVMQIYSGEQHNNYYHTEEQKCYNKVDS